MSERKLIIRKGEKFSCDNGHPYATALEDIWIDGPTPMRSDQFSFAPEQGTISTGTPLECNICKGSIWSMMRHHFIREMMSDACFYSATYDEALRNI